MATYYVDSNFGDDLNDGSAGQPWATLSNAISATTDGDTIEVAEYHYELAPDGLPDFSSRTDFSIKGSGTPGAAGTYPKIVCGTQLASGGWTNTGSGYYSKSVTLTNVTAITCDLLTVPGPVGQYALTLDSQGRPKGILQKCNSLADLVTVNWGWYYSGGTCYLRLNGGADAPANKYMTWHKSGVAAMVLGEGCTDCHVENLCLICNCDGTAGKGYGLLMSGTGNSVDSVIDVYCGYHGCAFVGNGSYANTDNTMSNHLSLGCYGNGSAGGLSRFVAYADTQNVIYCNVYGGRACLFNPIDPGGTTSTVINVGVATAWKVPAGFYCHTSGTGTVVSVTYYNCWSVHYSDTPANCYDFAAANTGTPSNVTNPSTYPVRCIRCTVVGGDYNISQPAYISFENCTLDYTAVATKSTVTTGQFGYAATSGTSRMFFDGTEILTNLDGSGNRAFFIHTYANAFTFRNSSWYDAGTNATGSAHTCFLWAGGAPLPTANIIATGSIFGFASNSTTRLLHNGDTGTAAQKQFTDCVYFNITAGFYGTNAATNTQAEWTSVIDPNGVYNGTTNVYADTTGTTNLRLTTTFQGTRKTLSAYPALGVNMEPYTGNYGAWQYPLAQVYPRRTRSASVGGRPSRGGRPNGWYPTGAA